MSRKEKDVLVKTYETDKEYQKDANKMAQNGYQVGHVDVREKPPGCLGKFSFGFLASHKTIYTVTYRKKE